MKGSVISVPLEGARLKKQFTVTDTCGATNPFLQFLEPYSFAFQSLSGFCQLFLRVATCEVSEAERMGTLTDKFVCGGLFSFRCLQALHISPPFPR